MNKIQNQKQELISMVTEQLWLIIVCILLSRKDIIINKFNFYNAQKPIKDDTPSLEKYNIIIIQQK